MKIKIHRVVVLVIDHDDLGSEGVRREMEAVRYPNDCIAPLVMHQETEEIEWREDNHNQLNFVRERFGAFCELFGRRPSDA